MHRNVEAIWRTDGFSHRRGGQSASFGESRESIDSSNVCDREGVTEGHAISVTHVAEHSKARSPDDDTRAESGGDVMYTAAGTKSDAV